MKTFFRILLLALATMGAVRAQSVAITAPTGSFSATVPTMVSGTTTGAVDNVLLTANGVTIGSGVVTSNAWSVSWSPAAVGSYELRAQGRNSSNTAVGAAVVASVSVTGIAPTVTLAISGGGVSVPVGSSRYFTATAADDGAIARVEFYLDGNLAATDTTAPYNYLFTAPPATGLHTVLATAVDNVGLSTSSTAMTLEVPAAIGDGPTVGITSPFSGSFVPVAAATVISGTAADADGVVATGGVTVYVNGVTGPAAGLANGGVATLVNGIWSINWTPPATGAVALTTLATDDKANASISPAVTVEVTDTTSPAVSLALTPLPAGATTALPPLVNNVPAGSVRNVVATVTSARSIVRVEFFLDGTKIGEDTAPPYSHRFTAPATPGSYVLSARATDSAGLARDTQLNLAVNTAIGQPPGVSLLTPLSGTTVAPNASVSVAASATASGGSVASVQFYVNGNTLLLGANNGLLTASPYIATFTPTATGSYVLDAIVTDDRGNSRASNAVLVNAAFANPTIALVSPRADPTNPTTPVRITPNVPLTISVTAQGGGGAAVLLIEFVVDGVTIGTRTTPTTTGGTTYTFPWTPAANQLGPHLLYARVTDANSLSAFSSSINLNVASVVGTPPTVAITAPVGAATTGIQSLSTVNFVATAFATGTNNAIASVEFFLNDLSAGTAAREQTTNLYRLAYNFAAFDYSAITPDANGRYPATLYAIAKDTNGNQTISATTALAIAPSISAAPAVQLAAVGTPTVAQGTQFPLVATSGDLDGAVTSLQLFVNGVASGAAVLNPLPQAAIVYNATTAGRFNLYVVATDDSGNTAVSSPSVVLNVTAISAPVTSMVRPADDATVTTVNTPVFLEATAGSTDSTQVLTVSFVAAGTSGARATITNVQRVGTTNTYRAIWTPTVADTYTVTSTAAIGTTVSGNSGNSRRVVVNNIAGLAPTVALNVPVTATTASNVNFTATATDSDGSVVGVEFFLNRNSIGQATRDQLTNTWRMTASFAGVTPGAGIEVVALARDTAGNVAASPTSTLTVAAATSIAPSIAISASATDVAFSQQVQLTANARDTDGTVTGVQYFANGTAIGTSVNAATGYQVAWTPNQSGTFNVWATATDNSGNTAVAPTVPVTVRRNNPVLEDSAFILQTYQDIANTTTINPLVFASLNAQLAAGTLTRAQFAASLTGDPAFAPAVNLLAAYRVIMGQWPTPANYQALLPQARTNLAAAIGSILASNEYFAKFGVVPTVALLENPASAMPEAAFLARLWQSAGLGTPSALDHVRFRNNDTASATIGRGYNVVGLDAALAEFVTATNSTNAGLQKAAQAAALYYQLDRPPVTVASDDIAVRVTALAQLSDVTAMADAVLKDVLYAYRYVTILTHPQSLTVAPRSGALFRVEALGAPPLSYQWLLNGAPVAGATSPLLSLTNVDATRAGSYTVVVTSSAATATSDPATLVLSSTPTRLANISTRGLTASGADVLIGGFVVTGTGNRQMLIRVVGPTLAAGPFNVPGTLSNPRLEVYSGTNPVPILTNDDWGNQSGGATAVTAIQQAAARVSAFALPGNSADAAVLANLAPGSYTVQARGPNANAAGLVLIEVYDATPGAAGPKAVNVSTRGNVGTGNNILIAGFVVNGAVSRRLLIRGVGPTLTRFDLPAGAVLADPQIALIEQATGRTLRTNDDWAAGDDAAIVAAAAVGSGAFPLTNGSKDAAMIVMLPPGGYTVHLSGVNNGTGIGIVEVYDVDP